MGVPEPQAAAVPDETLDLIRRFERELVGGLSSNPLESLATVIGLGSALFFTAEAGKNPQVKDIWDAFHYVSTCASVGYARIFPVTALGKVIGGLVMLVGPSLTTRILDPAADRARRDEALLGKLDEILAEMRRSQPPPPRPRKRAAGEPGPQGEQGEP